MLTDFELFRKHCRADDFDDEGENRYLRDLLETAESTVIRYTGRTVDELCEMGGGKFPPELATAARLMGAHWYNQREAAAGVQMAEVPFTVSTLIKPFRRLCRQEDSAPD